MLITHSNNTTAKLSLSFSYFIDVNLAEKCRFFDVNVIINNATSHSVNNPINAYYVRGDILSLLQDYTPMANAVGNRIGINPTFKSALTTPLGLHMMEQVRETLGH